jgi:hypothetical protein
MPANLVLDGRARQPAQRQDALQGLLVEPATATAGGGGYFRVLPYRLSRALIRSVNRTDRRAAVFYLHPWELDPGQPRVAGTSLKTRLRHYLNLHRTAPRLGRLLRDFSWRSIERVFLAPTIG